MFDLQQPRHKGYPYRCNDKKYALQLLMENANLVEVLSAVLPGLIIAAKNSANKINSSDSFDPSDHGEADIENIASTLRDVIAIKNKWKDLLIRYQNLRADLNALQKRALGLG